MNDTASNLIDIPPTGLGRLESIMDGYKAYQILKAMLELELFDYLEQAGTSSPDEISIATKINLEYMPSLLQTLSEMDLLVKDGNKYYNSDLAAQVLVKNSPNYQGDIIKMLGNGGKWERVEEKLTRTGSKNKKGYDSSGIGWGTLTSLSQRCLQGELQQVSQAIVSLDMFGQAKSILDIGGGHGLYTISLCQVNPGMNGLIFDQPHVVDLTRKFIKKYNMEERISVQAGDISQETPVGMYDIVITSHVLYKFSRELSVMLQKISQCLKPGGLLASNHWFNQTPNSHSHPLQSPIQDLDEVLNSPGHNICPLDEYALHLQEAGFSIL